MGRLGASSEDKRRVIRFDLPGFGLTGPSPDGLYSSDADIRLLLAVLDKLGVEHCVLGGASLGGGIAWRAALIHPSRVDKIILVDAGGYPTTPISEPIGFRLASIPGMDWLFENILPRSLVEQGFRDVWGDPSRVTPEMVERSIELTQREGNRRVPGSLSSMARRQLGASHSRIEASHSYHLGWQGSPDSARKCRAFSPGYYWKYPGDF